MERKQFECLYCGEKFFANRKRKFCSTRCATLHNQRKHRKKYEAKNCVVCGKEFFPQRSTQVTCGNPECIKKRKKYHEENYKNANYKHFKWEGLPIPEKKKRNRKKLSVKQWNKLSASERWELMNLTELSGDIARMFPGKSFGQVRLLKEQGKLPEDFGKRTENNG